jgi:hypothetical protein
VEQWVETLKLCQQERDQLRQALEYYAHPEHYEPRETLSGPRPPGVLVDAGRTARQALSPAKPSLTHENAGSPPDGTDGAPKENNSRADVTPERLLDHASWCEKEAAREKDPNEHYLLCVAHDIRRMVERLAALEKVAEAAMEMEHQIRDGYPGSAEETRKLNELTHALLALWACEKQGGG